MGLRVKQIAGFNSDRDPIPVQKTVLNSKPKSLRMVWLGMRIPAINKLVFIGWTVSLLGMALWIYGYVANGHPALFDWHAHTPWWIADAFPNVEAESRD